MTAPLLIGVPDGPAVLPRVRAGAVWVRRRFDGWSDRRTDEVIAHRERRWLTDMRTEMRVRWREACERPQLMLSHGLNVPANGFGPGRAPLVRDIQIGDELTPTTMTVELRPGQLVDDLKDAGRELAAALLCHRLRLEPLGGPFVRVTLVESDPHAEVVTDTELIRGTIALGPDEYGMPFRLTPDRLPHLAVQ